MLEPGIRKGETVTQVEWLFYERRTYLCPPNGLAFSCRERAEASLQKPYDLAREAVNCNAVLGACWNKLSEIS
jgi:hypothetical protein